MLAYLKGPDPAATLGVDAWRIVILGHSMGGWVAVDTAADHPELAVLITYSAVDRSRLAGAPAPVRVRVMSENMEALVGRRPTA